MTQNVANSNYNIVAEKREKEKEKKKKKLQIKTRGNKAYNRMCAYVMVASSCNFVALHPFQ